MAPLTFRNGLQPEQPGKLHGKSAVVVLPVDPYRVHVYWTIEPAGLQTGMVPSAEQIPRTGLMLRFHCIPRTSSELERSTEFFDVPTAPDALNLYVHLPKPSGRYLVELGIETDDGRFSVLARSAPVQMPPASPSENEEETSMSVLGDLVLLHPLSGHPNEQLAKDAPTPPPGQQPMTPDHGETTGPAHPEPGVSPGLRDSKTFTERHVVEENEESFTSGLSSRELGADR